MTYFLDLFSPETYGAFKASDRSISGFRERHRSVARRIRQGDKLVCYLTRLSRWFGILEVIDGPFEDATPIFYPHDDPFVIRFHVNPLVVLDVEHALPVRSPEAWSALSFTKDLAPTSNEWGARVRGSLARLTDADGLALERLINGQASSARRYPLSDDDHKKLAVHTVKRADKVVTVTVPDEIHGSETSSELSAVRESIKMQALLAEIGLKMGLTIWIPKADRNGVLSQLKDGQDRLLERLPLNYDDTTLRTVEQIDVIWLRGRSIVRAFEVEHTTSVYSGILRMADLLALQPNMNIRLHIVAPDTKRDKVFQEIQRPVFALLERGPLSETCTYLPYESVIEISNQRHLSHLSDSVLDDYAESSEE